MEDYGVNRLGFKKKSYQDIVESMQNRAQSLFGNVNVGDNSPLGILIKVVAYALALIWSGLEGVYNSAFVDTATGQSLDYLGKYIGISRKEATKAKGVIKFIGEAGVKIPQGFKVQSLGENPIQFQTLEEGSLEANNKVKVGVLARDKKQEINIATETLTTLKEELKGVSKVTNPIPIEAGQGTVEFTAQVGTIIPQGTIILTSSEPVIEFETIAAVEVKGGESNLELPIEALEAGSEANLPRETIVKPINSLRGLDKLYNPLATTGGSDRESDAEFRSRYCRSVSNSGSATIDSLIAGVYEVPNVESVLILENDSNQVDQQRGLPPKSFEVVVLGGSREEIGQAIFANKAAGIEAAGQIEVMVEDIGGNQHLLKFSRPETVDIYVEVSELIPGAHYGPDSELRIKDEIIKYIGGKDSYGRGWSGLGFGQPVIYNKVIDAAFNVAGVEDAKLRIKRTDGSFQSSNLSLEQTELAVIRPNQITVQVRE